MSTTLQSPSNPHECHPATISEANPKPVGNGEEHSEQIEDDFVEVELTPIQQLQWNLRTKAFEKDILPDFDEIQKVFNKLIEFRRHLRSRLGNAARFDWGDQGDVPRPLKPAVENIIARKKAYKTMDVEQFITQGVIFTLKSVLEADLSATTDVANRMDYAVKQWKSWNVEQILEGLKIASPRELKKIRQAMSDRFGEQKHFLQDCRLGITNALNASAKEFDKVYQKVGQKRPNKDSESALLTFIDAFEWNSLEDEHLDSSLRSLIALKEFQAVKLHRAQRKSLLDLMPKVQPAPQPAHKITYFGTFPSLRSLNDDIMKISCIASAVPRRAKRKGDGSGPDSTSNKRLKTEGDEANHHGDSANVRSNT